MAGDETPIRINIFMDILFKNKADWLSYNYEKEIGGFILGEIKPEGVFIQDLLIPKQEVGHGSVDFDKKDLIEMREQNSEKCKKIIGEWHSHNTMGCFWSSTDEELINQFCEGRDATVFIVSSKGNHLIRFELRNPVKLSLNKLSCRVIDEDLEEEMRKEISEKIKQSETKTSKSNQEWWDNFKDTGKIGIQKADASEIMKNIQSKNAVHLNKKVKVFNIDAILKSVMMEEFENYEPAETGYQGRDLIFTFSNSQEAKNFFNVIVDFIQKWNSDGEQFGDNLMDENEEVPKFNKKVEEVEEAKE